MSPGVRISSPEDRSVEQPSVSAGLRWSGRILTALVVLEVSAVLFPVYFGALVWLGLYFREARRRGGSFAKLI